MRQLTDGEIVDVLQANETGVLAFNDCNGPNPYSVPVAFGYDDERDLLAMQLEGDENSHKRRCLQRDRNVSLTVYEESDTGILWESVMVRGELTETSFEAAEPALAVIARNTQDIPNPVRWGDSATVTPFELEINEWSGRAFDIE